MQDKILGVISFGLCAASQAFISHDDTAVFFGVLFFLIGGYEFLLGEIRQRKSA